MKICFICNEYPPGPHGGIGTFTQVMARNLAAAGHEVRCVGVYPPDYPADNQQTDGGVHVRRLRTPRGKLGWLRARRDLYRTVADWAQHGEIELVELPDWEGWAAHWPRLPVPVIVRLHGCGTYFADELGQKVRRAVYYLERSSLLRADRWCSVSQYTADKTKRLLHLPTEPAAILYNSVESQAECSPQGRSRRDVLFTGTLTRKKGILSLLEAWPRVLEKIGDGQLHIYGKDTHSADGESMVDVIHRQANGLLGSSVHLHGHVTRETLYEQLQRARLAVFPSYSEAFALAPLEAMATGCPTIYSRRGSGPELMEDGRHGLLVDPDDPQQIAESIIRVLSDDQLAQRLGSEGRRQVQHRFAAPLLLSQNELFYRKSIAQFQNQHGAA